MSDENDNSNVPSWMNRSSSLWKMLDKRVEERRLEEKKALRDKTVDMSIGLLLPFLNAWALLCVWSWFCAPSFPGLKLNYLFWLGTYYLTVFYVRLQLTPSQVEELSKRTPEEKLKMTTASVFIPVGGLSVAWCLHYLVIFVQWLARYWGG